MNKKVGVVIPIYNVEKYLRECLDSVINQTYKNLEIVLVNDGSTDENSLNIAKEYTLKDERFILFDKENGGQSTARNVGIEYFSGEYKLQSTNTENDLIEFNVENNHYNIYKAYKSSKVFNNEQDLTNFTYPIIDYIIFLDSDDYWELNCIEECVPRMEGVEIVWFDHFFYYDDIEKPDIIPSTILEGYGLNHSGIISLKYWLDRTAYIKQNSFWFGWHGMINFNYLKFIKLKFLDKISHEDHYFAKLLFFQSKYIFVLLKKLYFYRQRTDSIMSSIKNPNLNSLALYNNYIYKEFKDIKLTRQYYRHSSLFLTAAMVFKFIEENQDKQYIEIFQYIFSEKLKLWRNEILHFPEKCLGFILYDIFLKLINLSNSAEYTLHFISDFFKDVIIDNSLYNKNLYDQIESRGLKLVSKANKILNLENIIQEKEKLLSFQTKYGTARSHIQNQLSYKLGQAMIVNSKSFLGYIRMPFVLSYIKDKHKQEQKIYQEKIKKDLSLKLPFLEQYPDYKEALKEKECFTYKLGQAFI